MSVASATRDFTGAASTCPEQGSDGTGPSVHADSGTAKCGSREATLGNDTACESQPVAGPRGFIGFEWPECSGPTLTVGLGARADFQSIAEAIRHAEPMSRVLVWPGIYHESITLDKPLEIVGAGHGGLPVIATSRTPSVVLVKGAATLRGVTLHYTGGDARGAAVIEQDGLRMLGCRVVCSANAAVAVNAGASVLLERTRVRNEWHGGCGISIGRGGSCGIIGSVVAAPRCVVHADPGCSVLIEWSRLLPGLCGIYIARPDPSAPAERATTGCTIDESEIDGASVAGIFVGGGSHHRADHVLIRQCKGNGVVVARGADLAMVDCRILCAGRS